MAAGTCSIRATPHAASCAAMRRRSTARGLRRSGPRGSEAVLPQERTYRHPHCERGRWDRAAIGEGVIFICQARSPPSPTTPPPRGEGAEVARGCVTCSCQITITSGPGVAR